LLGNGDDLILLEKVNEPQQGQADHSAMAVATGDLFNKRANPQRYGHEVRDSLLRKELTERKELVGANAHCAWAVSLLRKAHEEIVDRFSQPGTADARVGLRAG
jgi:hypothetical protein